MKKNVVYLFLIICIFSIGGLIKSNFLKSKNPKNSHVVYDVAGLQHQLRVDKTDLSFFLNGKRLASNSHPGYLYLAHDQLYILSSNGYLFRYTYDHGANFIDSNLPERLNEFGKSDIRSVVYSEALNKVFVSYLKKVSNNCYSMGIDQANLDQGYLKFESFFSSNYCVSENTSLAGDFAIGGRLATYKRAVYLAIGAFDKNETDKLKEDNEPSHYGVILSINEFAQARIISRGHRNPYGLIVNEHGIFAAENGPMGGDQFMSIKSNQDYGWPIYSYGFGYKGLDLYKRPKNPEFSEPIFYWTPSIAPSQMVYYSGNEFPRFQNKIILSSLGSTSLYILSSDDFTSRIQSVEPYKIEGSRMRDMVIDSNGKLIILTDDLKLLTVYRNQDKDIPLAYVNNEKTS